MKVELSIRDISTIWFALERDIRSKQWIREIDDKKKTTIGEIILHARELSDEAALCERMEKLFYSRKEQNNDA